MRLSPSTNFYRAPASDGQRNVGLDSSRSAVKSDYPAFLLKEWFLCVSDAGAHVEICGGGKAHSRSLDCARDDKLGASGACRHCLRREANTGGKPAYACPSNATRCCNSNATHGGRPTPLARALWSEAEGCGEKCGFSCMALWQDYFNTAGTVGVLPRTRAAAIANPPPSFADHGRLSIPRVQSRSPADDRFYLTGIYLR